MQIQFTDREADIMEILWLKGPSLVAEVRAHLRDDLAYNTVLTILRTLESKGYVSHTEEGRGHRYQAAVKQREAQESALRHLTRKLFQGSTELLFTRLVADEKLSAEQIAVMRDLLAKKSTQRGEK